MVRHICRICEGDHTMFGWRRNSTHPNIIPVRVIIIPQIIRENLLLMRPVVPPSLTPLIPSPVLLTTRAPHPGIKDLKRIRQVLGYDKACVDHGHTVAVAKVAIEINGVARHREGGIAGDIPAVEKPFEGQGEMADCGIGIKENDELMAWEEVGD